MIEFRINEYITLRLKDKKTFIFISEEQFQQCKYLLLKIPIGRITSFNEMKSIDESSNNLNHTLETGYDDSHPYEKEIPPETEFWGHCSNLQVWYENNYNSRLLHRNLAFPLLKKLTEVGDPLAKKVFKEEIAKRLKGHFIPTLIFLLNEHYLDYFIDEEFESLIDDLMEKNHNFIKEDILLNMIAGKYEIDMPIWNEREIIFSILHPNLNLLTCMARFGKDYRVTFFMDWVYESLTIVNQKYPYLLREKIKKILGESKPDEKENLLYFIEDIFIN